MKIFILRRKESSRLRTTTRTGSDIYLLMDPNHRRIVVNLLISELSVRGPDEIQVSIHVLKSSVEVVMRLDLFPKPTLVEKSLEEVDQTPSS